MKKINKKIIVIIIILALTGCNRSTNDIKINLEESDSLKVGMDLKYPPFMYLDEFGNPAGLEVDIAKELGVHLRKTVEIINTDFSMLMSSLETEETDILISDISINEERKAKVDFTNPYRYGRTLALVNRKFYDENNISNQMTAEEFFSLNNIKAIGLSGTISVSIPKGYGVDVTEVMEIGPGIIEIVSGNYNVLIGTNTVLGDHMANRETTKIYDGILDYSESAFAVKKGNRKLLEKSNEFIDELYSKGGLYEKLSKKYDKSIDEYLQSEGLGLKYIITKPE